MRTSTASPAHTPFAVPNLCKTGRVVTLPGVAGSDGMSIGEVSALLGVPVPTLRSWHLRYGVALPARTRGGHRRYQDADVALLQQLSAAVANGIAPRTAAQALREPRADVRVPLALLTDLLAAADARDQDALRAVLERSLEQVGLDATVDRLLVPGLRELGERWQLGRIDVGVEHLATAAARRWIGLQVCREDPAQPLGPVLLAAAPGNEHTVALEAFELLLRSRGCSTRLLGADTPLPSLFTALHATGARAVVLTAQQVSRSRSAVATLRALQADSDAAIYYAGAAFDSPRRRAGLPGCYLGTVLPEAADVVAAPLAG